VYLDPPLPRDVDLTGQVIHFGNKIPWDTSYTIRAVGEDSVSTGSITIVAGFQKAGDFSSGYKYLVNPGDTYTVPTIAGLDR